MKKFLAILFMFAIVAISNVSAKEVNFVLEAYVAEKVIFEITEDGYYVNSNTTNVCYDFYDFESNVTDAYSARIFAIVTV
jgi:hypothetical protein